MTALEQDHTDMIDLPADVDVAVVGSGFSGLAMARQLKRSYNDDFVVLERGDDVGGTWRDNTYPGCTCDVPSHLYSFSFALNPEWSNTFSPQPEIKAYIRRTAEEHGLLPHIRFNTEVLSAAWDEQAQRWRLETSRGPVSARVLIAGAGPLSEPRIPDVPGIENFKGKVFHSAQWDHEHDLRGERVAVVGTGASSIQFVPRIQPEVEKLHLFQRTAPWITPRPDRPITRFEKTLYRRVPAAQRLMRRAIYWGRELYAIPMLRARLSSIVKLIALRQLKQQVPDPELRAKLTPDYAPGCKRILVANDYYPSLSKPNVEVLTGGVKEIREHSVVNADGTEREVDTIIFGTGFHVTDLPIGQHVRGRGGRTLDEVWQGSPQMHRGTAVAGYPNFFFLLGPNTGLGHTSVVLMAEAQARYISQAIGHMRSRGLATVEVRAEAQRTWNEEVQRRMKGTVWTTGGCASWYIDSKGLNTTLWPDFSFRFVRAMREFRPDEHVFEPAGVPQRVPVAA